MSRTNLLSMFMVAVLAFFAVACEQAGNETARTYEDFEVWMDEETANLENASQEEWAQFEQEFNEWTADLDGQMEDWDDDRRQAYEERRSEFDRLQAENRQRWESDASTGDLAEWEQQIWNREVGTNYENLAATDMEQSYTAFIEFVRANSDNWTEADWERADQIYERLGDRREQVEEQLSTEDRAEIATMQAEYEARDGWADVENAVTDDNEMDNTNTNQ